MRLADYNPKTEQAQKCKVLHLEQNDTFYETILLIIDSDTKLAWFINDESRSAQ